MKVTNKERDARNRSMCDMYQSGVPIAEIAEDLNLHRETVRQTLERYGVYKRSKLPEAGDVNVQMAKDLRVRRTCVADGKTYIDDTDFLIGR